MSYSHFASGQQVNPDSTKVLRGVEIRAARENEILIGMKSRCIDSLDLRLGNTGSLNRLLELSTSLNTKTYSQGGMSTLSFRGTTASQSGIFWNGFNIKGRSTSMTDLSLVPVFFFPRVEVMYGGSSTLYGSGNIGGSIHLNEAAVFNHGLQAEAGLAYGSFGAVEPSLKVRVSGQRWASSTAIIYRHADNDYPYVFAGTESHQVNAAVTTQALCQQFDARFRENNHLNLALWVQDDDKGMPPPATGSSSQEHRRDKSMRVSSRWKSDLAPGAGYSAGIAFLHDDMHYTNVSQADGKMLVDSRIINDALLGDLSGYKRLGTSWELSLRTNFEYAEADVNSFGGSNMQGSASISGGAKKKWFDGKWITVLDFRQEWVDGYEVPFCPYFGMEGWIGKALKLYANASKNFRVPSLNDRYWVPGGNEDLLPEISLNAEAGMSYPVTQGPSFKINSRFSVFVSEIDNQIAWIPSGSLWTAENVQHVSNKGIELGFDASYTFPGSLLELTLDYTYVSSENKSKSMPNDASSGKQQIYTPRNRAVARLAYSLKGLYAYVNTSFTGVTYCTRDNSEQLPANTLADLGLRYRFSPGKVIKFELGGTISNLLDHQYQFIQYYPAPGRSFRLELICKFK